MKTEQAYSEIMNQLEVIHGENCAIYNALLTVAGIDTKTRETMIKMWDKRFQDERLKGVIT